jgi:hypothetical protein
MSNFLTQRIQEMANKTIEDRQPSLIPKDNTEKIQRLLREADKKEDEFNNEKGTLDVFMVNGQTLSKIVQGTSKPDSSQGKYKMYLEKKLKETEKNIKDFKNKDKFYRRDFLSAGPLTAQGNPFWSNWDNWILTAFWSAVLVILISTSMAIFGLPIDSSQQQSLIIAMWISVPLLLLYLIQLFG